MNNGKRILVCKAFVFITLTGFVLSSTGCEPLRKKFTRKKREERTEEFTPILDPIEYPTAVHNPEKDYSRFYGLWKVWQTELLQELEKNESERRQIYLLDEAITQLNEMKKYLKEDKQKEFAQILASYSSIREEYQTPAPMRRTSTLKRTLERNGQTIINNFSPKKIPDSIMAP
jgi:hypothetical protein